VFDKGLMGMALEDDRGEQRRINHASSSRPVFEAWHVIDAYECAVTVEHRERAAKADVDAEIQSHGADLAIASEAVPSAIRLALSICKVQAFDLVIVSEILCCPRQGPRGELIFMGWVPSLRITRGLPVFPHKLCPRNISNSSSEPLH
jgi:hypothetical protein